jgi:hypothetical protein
MGWMIGILGFDSWKGLGIFFFTTMSRTDLGPTKPTIQQVLGALSLGVKQLRCEADQSPPSSAKVKECMELYLHSPIHLHGMVHRNNFTFTIRIFTHTHTRMNACKHKKEICNIFIII